MDHPYTREQAAFPAPWTREHKFWPAVAASTTSMAIGISSAPAASRGFPNPDSVDAAKRPVPNFAAVTLLVQVQEAATNACGTAVTGPVVSSALQGRLRDIASLLTAEIVKFLIRENIFDAQHAVIMAWSDCCIVLRCDRRDEGFGYPGSQVPDGSS